MYNALDKNYRSKYVTLQESLLATSSNDRMRNILAGLEDCNYLFEYIGDLGYIDSITAVDRNSAILDYYSLDSMLSVCDDIVGYSTELVTRTREDTTYLPQSYIQAPDRENLGPFANVLFDKMFDVKTRRLYVNTKTNNPAVHPVQQFAKHFKPAGVMAVSAHGRITDSYMEKMAYGGELNSSCPLNLPVNRLYGLERLNNANRDEGVHSLPLFFCIGPGDELLKGKIGRKTHCSPDKASRPQSVLKRRQVRQGPMQYVGDPVDVYDQKLTSCFYVGESRYTNEAKVAETLRDICKEATQTTKVVAKNTKYIGVVRVGTVLCTGGGLVFKDNGYNRVSIETFQVDPGHDWHLLRYREDNQTGRFVGLDLFTKDYDIKTAPDMSMDVAGTSTPPPPVIATFAPKPNLFGMDEDEGDILSAAVIQPPAIHKEAGGGKMSKGKKGLKKDPISRNIKKPAGGGDDGLI